MRFHPSLAPRDLPLLLDALPAPVIAVDTANRLAAASAAWTAIDPAAQPGEPAADAIARAVPCLAPAAIDALLAGEREFLVCSAAPGGLPARTRLTRAPVESSAAIAAVLTLLPEPAGEPDRYRRLVEEANDIMFSLDRQGRFTEMNRLGYEVSGYTPAELIDSSAASFVVPEHRPRVAEALARIWAGEHVPVLEVEFVFKSGERRWFEVKGRTVRDGDAITGTFHVARDITDRRALSEARDLLSRAAAAAPIVIWAIDMEGRYTLLEGGALGRYGLRPGELVGQSIFEFNRDAPERLAEVRRGLAGEAFTTTGSWRDTVYEAHYVPLRDASGAQSGLMAVVLDITERVRAAEARARADKLEALTILAGGVAHDFNNLLVGILGNAALALLDLPAESPARPILQEIEDAARRLADLSRQMLAFSGRGQFVRQQVDVNAVVAEAVAAAGRDHPVERQLDRGLPPVLGDPGQLRLAVAALLANAVEASPPGVPVAIRTRREAVPAGGLAHAHPGPLPAGDYVVVEVIDRGEGIDPALHHRIFEPFFTTRFTGRGLGLAAVSGIARGHRGAVVVESAPGAGSAFRLYLPAAPAGS
ncbi:PAS domain S-box protein [Tepidiforma sp.]|uniref:PAS domain-containing sensor histidine kinase n=1 Tax=Tepidiforma sp. TaxID=2682230 RepID=UPI0026022CB0|nr:PAS domain S-box protein [Tepidiforma sp.]MCX7617802.1 PAS domain S-box protein [Tepidiforma sp.]